MNLTVAVKIIGGFSIISILLVVTSVSSLLNLNTIQDSTTQVRELAIPTVVKSNSLALELSQMGILSLRGYFQNELAPLNENKQAYLQIQSNFNKALAQLKGTVKDEPQLLSNLKKVGSLNDHLAKSIDGVFANRQIAIEQIGTLSDKIDVLEEKSDDAATLLLDLADHDLADTRLQKAVDMGEFIETTLNGIVSSAFEYRDSLDASTVDLVGKEISSSAEELEKQMIDVVNEMKANGAADEAEELSIIFEEIRAFLTGNNTIFDNKTAQLNAIDLATQRISEAESDIDAANEVLEAQVRMANDTTNNATQEVGDAVDTGTSQTIAIMVVSIILAAVIARITLVSITRPLARVNNMLNVVASGDLSNKLDESGKDEFALLSRNCNSLIDSLRSLIQGIVSRSTQLATAAEEMSAVTAQSTTAIEEQRTQVEQAASATTQMSSTSQSVLSSANDALGEIKQADDEAERVKGISNKNRETIQLLAEEVESASQVINKLQQDSATIGGILDVIRSIAEQTNLLALNAAIEAARAGEHGRGFAVVADEVRTLASRTQESTQEIQNMIEVLQSGAEKAVSVMDIGKAQAANCVEQSEVADKALETITHAVHEAYDRSTQIASAAEEQSVVAHEISENLESIVTIAEQTTSGSQQTAASSGEVAHLAEELQQSVQEFKV